MCVRVRVRVCVCILILRGMRECIQRGRRCSDVSIAEVH